MTTTTCEIRLKAAEILEQRGWLQYGRGGDCGETCLAGAIVFAITGDAWENHDVTNPVCESMGFPNTEHAIRWNDTPRRTKEEVLARLRDGCEPVKASAESAS